MNDGVDSFNITVDTNTSNTDATPRTRRSRAGPFDMVFVVGPLTSSGDEAGLSPILAGETPPAVPVYFFDAGESSSLSAKLEEHSCKPNVVLHIFRTMKTTVKIVYLVRTGSAFWVKLRSSVGDLGPPARKKKEVYPVAGRRRK